MIIITILEGESGVTDNDSEADSPLHSPLLTSRHETAGTINESPSKGTLY